MDRNRARIAPATPGQPALVDAPPEQRSARASRWASFFDRSLSRPATIRPSVSADRQQAGNHTIIMALSLDVGSSAEETAK
jgi:hypothetical protein